MYCAPRSYQGSWYSGQTFSRLGTYEWLSGWSSSVYTILLSDAGTGEDEVERLTRRADLRQHLVVVAVRRHLHLDVVLLTEGLHDSRGHVLVVVQDLEGAARLGIESVTDGWVAVLDRQGHRTVGPSQRVGRRAVLCLLRVVVASTGSEKRCRPQPDAEPEAAPQQVSAGELWSRCPTTERLDLSGRSSCQAPSRCIQDVTRALLHDTSATSLWSRPGPRSHELNTQSIIAGKREGVVTCARSSLD